MAKPRTFDWDEAKRRYEAGETQTAIAKEYGVSPRAVWWACHPDKYKASFARSAVWLREHRTPCLGNCGKLVYMHSRYWSQAGKRVERSGLCMQCLAKQQREQANHGTESVYAWCRCDLCRIAASTERAVRRERSKVPCSHGCGTLVHKPVGKQPECNPCVVKRLKAEGRLGRVRA